MATAKEMRDSVAENALKTKPKETAEKETITTDEPPEMSQFYGDGPGTNYMNPDGDPYSYRVYDDGSIEIIAGPSGVGTVLTEGKMHGLIKDALLGAEASAEAPAEMADEMERLSSPAPEIEMPESTPEIEIPTPEIEEPDAALASLEGTMPTYIADEEHLGQLREGFEESLPQEALAEQSGLDAEQTLVDEDAARQEEEAGRQAEREEAAIGREQSGNVSGGLAKLYELAKRMLAEEDVAKRSPSEDTGLPDDSGLPLDSGLPGDTGLPLDSGLSMDTGFPDDSGLPLDSGLPMDTGAPGDTGLPLDSGQPDDSGLSKLYNLAKRLLAEEEAQP